MNDTVVYRHRKPNGEVFYVGIGNERRPTSKWDRNQWWNNVVNKYVYEVEILATGLSWEDACELEELLIEEYGRKDLGTGTLVNLTNGGEGVKGLAHSKEARQKIGAANKGKKLSEETRKKLSVAHKGKKLSKEHRQKIGAAGKSRKLSKEARQKISAAHKGKNNYNYGKKLSKETKQKISAANRGKNAPWYSKKFSKEHRQKISAAKSGKPSHKRKLTFEQAQEIRKRYQTEKTSYRKLAKEYGVSDTIINNIIQNKSYKK